MKYDFQQVQNSRGCWGVIWVLGRALHFPFLADLGSCSLGAYVINFLYVLPTYSMFSHPGWQDGTIFRALWSDLIFVTYITYDKYEVWTYAPLKPYFCQRFELWVGHEEPERVWRRSRNNGSLMATMAECRREKIKWSSLPSSHPFSACGDCGDWTHKLTKNPEAVIHSAL